MEEIDLKELFMILMDRIWLIIITTLLAGVLVFGFTKLFIRPQYTSSIKMYVNNTTGIKSDRTSGDINAAQAIVDTYITIIQSDTVLNEVINRTQVPYTPGILHGMISSRSLNNTEVFQVNVTAPDPMEAATLANAVADTAPEFLTEIVSGSSVKIIDRPVINENAVSPNYLTNTMIGLVLGFMLAVGYVLLVSLMDTRIRTEQDLSKITDLPVLGAISEFTSVSKQVYGFTSREGL